MLLRRGADFFYVGRAGRHSEHSALAILGRAAGTPAGMQRLRDALAAELPPGVVEDRTDEQIVGELARRVASGQMMILSEHPRPGAWPPFADAPAPAPEEAPAPAKTPSLRDPRWSAPRTGVGEEVDALFTYSDLDPQTEVTVEVFECDASGDRTSVGTVQTQVPSDRGDHRVSWKREPEDAEVDLLDDEAAGDTGPVEYRFTVEAPGVARTGESGPLWLTNTVQVTIVGDDGQEPAEDGTEVVLRTADGEVHRAATSGGKARFEHVVVGPLRFELAGPAELVHRGG